MIGYTFMHINFSQVSKKLVLALTVFFLVVPFASSQEEDVFYGEWGTRKQCSGEPLIKGGSKTAAPFDIRSDWLGHGGIWCRLHWVSVVSIQDGTSGFARAVCGEDDTRDYVVSLLLAKGVLTLTWDQWLENGPLMRCKG